MNLLPALLLSAALLSTAACSSKKDDAQPAAPASTSPAVGLTYREGSGPAAALTDVRTYFVTATPVQAGERRMLGVQATLPDGRRVDIAYSFVGRNFPGATGPVVLNGLLRIDCYPLTGTGAGTRYEPAATTGSVSVDEITPHIISGTYTGPLVAGGREGQLVFTRLSVPN